MDDACTGDALVFRRTNSLSNTLILTDMKKHTYFIKCLLAVLCGFAMPGNAIAQCVTPVITDISNSGPVCAGGTLTLHAEGTVGGAPSTYTRMAGIGGNFGSLG